MQLELSETIGYDRSLGQSSELRNNYDETNLGRCRCDSWLKQDVEDVNNDKTSFTNHQKCRSKKQLALKDIDNQRHSFIEKPRRVSSDDETSLSVDTVSNTSENTCKCSELRTDHAKFCTRTSSPGKRGVKRMHHRTNFCSHSSSDENDKIANICCPCKNKYHNKEHIGANYSRCEEDPVSCHSDQFTWHRAGNFSAVKYVPTVKEQKRNNDFNLCSSECSRHVYRPHSCTHSDLITKYTKQRTKTWKCNTKCIKTIAKAVVICVIVSGILCTIMTLVLMKVILPKYLCIDCRTLGLPVTGTEETVLGGYTEGLCCIDKLLPLLRHHTKEQSEIREKLKDLDIKVKARELNMTTNDYTALYKTIQEINNMINNLYNDFYSPRSTRQTPAIHLSSTSIGRNYMPLWSEDWSTGGIQYAGDHFTFNRSGLYFLYCNIKFREGDCSRTIMYSFVEQTATRRITLASAANECIGGKNHYGTLTLERVINVRNLDSHFFFHIDESKGGSLLSTSVTHNMGLFRI